MEGDVSKTTAAQIGPEALGKGTLCPVIAAIPSQPPPINHSKIASRELIPIVNEDFREPIAENATAVASKAKSPTTPIMR
jgi:hypothetical protein